MLGDAYMLALAFHAGCAPGRTRCGRGIMRKALGAGASVIALTLAASAVQAACVDDFNFIGRIPQPIGPDKFVPSQDFFPLGRGSSLSALTSTMNTVNTAFLSGTNAFINAPPGARADQVGGGVWGRAIGGQSDISSSSVGTLDFSKVDPKAGLGTATGQQTCNTTVHQDFAGFQIGYDVATLNAGNAGSNIHFGFTA